MAEKVTTLNWDEVSLSENVTEADFKKAETLGGSVPVGLFVCDIKEPSLFQKSMKEYSCAAIGLKMEVVEVLELEQPVIDDEGKAVIRNGEPLMKLMPVGGTTKINADAQYKGMNINDDVFMPNSKEKDGMKNRRLFVARKIGIISGPDELTTAKWRNVAGRRVIVRTEWNHWTDKDTKEPKKNVKVGYSGYEHISTLDNQVAEVDLSGV